MIDIIKLTFQLLISDKIEVCIANLTTMTLLMELTLFASFKFPSLPYIMTKFLTWFEILKECAFVDLLLIFLELCLKSLLHSIFLLGLLITVKFWFWFLYSMFEDLIVAIHSLWYKKTLIRYFSWSMAFY